jgi:hypothetical protein
MRLERGILIIWFTVGGAFAAPGALCGASHNTVVAGMPAETKPKIKLSDAVEKALADLASEAVKIKRETRNEDMQKVIAEIAEITKVNAEQRKKLEDEVRPAVDRSLASWKDEFDARLRPYLSNEGEGALAMLSQWPAEQLVRSGFPGEFGRPEEDAGWKEALKRTLTPEQYEALDKVAGERDRKLDEQISGYLKPFIEQSRQSREAVLATEIEDMKQLLKLSDDRTRQLQEKAAASADRAADSMGKHAAKTLRAMQEQQRASVIASGRSIFNAGDEGDDDADADETSHDVWDKAVADLLNDEERRRWEAAAAERSDRGARALAMMFVAEMDRRVQFSSGQRAKIEGIATRVLAEKARNMSKNDGVSLTHATLFKSYEVRPLLDVNQWARWEAAGRGEYNGRYGSRRAGGRAGGEEKNDENSASKGDREPPDEEQILAAHFERRLLDKRREMTEAMEAKVDDVRRVVRLAPDRSRYLEIAAKGAVERSLDAWRLQIDSWVRNSVQRVKADALRKRLAGMDNDNVWFGEEITPADHAVWKDALAAALTEDQKKSWKNEVMARDSYRQRAYAWGILAEMNRRYHLSNDQFNRLEPLVETAVTEYHDDFANMFGRGSSTVMPRYLITLFAAVPEDKAQEVLNAAQWKQWKESDFKQVSGWWESMKNTHRWKTQKK